jgi:hypothetical protein
MYLETARATSIALVHPLVSLRKRKEMIEDCGSSGSVVFARLIFQL